MDTSTDSHGENIQRLRRLSLALAKVEQRERDRLARILHDELQQTLVAAQFKASKLAKAEVSRLQVQDEAKAILKMIDQCLRTSRNLSTELSPSVLQDTSVLEVVKWLAGWFEQNYELKVSVRGEEDLPRADSTVRLVIFQVLRELLLNIFKHSGQDRAEIEVGCDDGRITLFVKDSGEGFDPGILQDSLNEGIGLSSIAERLEAIRGRWEVESAPGGGARFRIWFPSEGIVDQGESNERSLVRLLVADDHKMVREGITSLLEEQPDFVVVGEARDGKEAVALADQLEPDLVIMDVEMPELDGIQATQAILKQQPDIFVVGLSMHEDKGYAEKMKQAGAAAHEDKATASVHLIKTIRRVFDERIGDCPPVLDEESR